jgi:hypothetical protein
MGAIRKLGSLSSLGLVDWNNTKERKARAAGKTADAEMVRAQAEANLNNAKADGKAKRRKKPEPGWYVDPSDSTMLTWFDGKDWTEFRRPIS